MDRLWAPWRKAYIRPKAGKTKGCLFCRIRGERRDARNFVLKRSPSSFALLNLYPYNNGHVMIVPNRHLRALSQLSAAEKLGFLALYDEVIAALEAALKPHGMNVGINLGKTAGAGVPGHLHLHIVPRWKGDTNFMPVVGNTKLISESLDSVYHALTRRLRKISSPRKKNR